MQRLDLKVSSSIYFLKYIENMFWLRFISSSFSDLC